MRLLLFSCLLVFFLASCRKQQDNTRPAHITGTVFDLTSKKGMANVSVNISWVGPALQKQILASLSTDTQGRYDIRIPLDISRFANQSLDVEAVVPDKYISIHDLEHPSVGASTVGYHNEHMAMPVFNMYQGTNLTIHLKRSSTDSFSRLELLYGYSGRNYWVNPSNPLPTGTASFTVVTAAGVSTKVQWVKRSASGILATFQDSIVCQPDFPNTITIPY